MQIFTQVDELRAHLNQQRNAGKSIGLVPTMGNLHAGHLRLIATARQQADHTVCTIFVNPLQFGEGEDLDAYPRTLEEDKEKLAAAGCNCLFAPDVKEIYGDSSQAQTTIHVPEISENFCGKSRPGHFDGVATVVCKLFNLANPDKAVFGLKDYQQFLVIQKLVNDLSLDVELIGVATEREASGLALSSRNNYLSPEQREQAASLYQTLQATAANIESGARDYPALEIAAKQALENVSIEIDYFSICHAQTLQAARAEDNSLVILAAAYVGPSRLIDNILIQLD